MPVERQSDRELHPLPSMNALSAAASDGSQPFIRLEQVTRLYPMGDEEVRALDGVSLSIEAGEFVAVMGPSGSGKSTLMNVLGFLDHPSSGRYLLAGRDVSGLDANERATLRNQLIGFAFQHFNLLPRTSALENVELPLLYAGIPARERHQRAADALAHVGLADRIHHLPGQLSGGQQQRVAIARAIANGPRLLLADEPTGSLDSRTSIEVMGLFQQLCRSGITVLVVTHEPDVARFAGRIITLRDGRLVADARQTAAAAESERPASCSPIDPPGSRTDCDPVAAGR
jgi:putative ABC transport system ATP-binding protein